MLQQEHIYPSGFGSIKPCPNSISGEHNGATPHTLSKTVYLPMLDVTLTSYKAVTAAQKVAL